MGSFWFALGAAAFVGAAAVAVLVSWTVAHWAEALAGYLGLRRLALVVKPAMIPYVVINVVACFALVGGSRGLLAVAFRVPISVTFVAMLICSSFSIAAALLARRAGTLSSASTVVLIGCQVLYLLLWLGSRP